MAVRIKTCVEAGGEFLVVGYVGFAKGSGLDEGNAGLLEGCEQLLLFGGEEWLGGADSVHGEGDGDRDGDGDGDGEALAQCISPGALGQ
jgi:hypothetical protein